MSAPGNPTSEENPFSASRIRPGGIPYQFPPGQSVEALVERFDGNGRRGQIVGPHGSGKSSLLASLVTEFQRQGRQTLLIELHDGQRRLPPHLRSLSGLIAGTVVIVDGYEQLSALSRLLLGIRCRRRELGLIVTAHTSAGIADLYRTTGSLRLARRLVGRLQNGSVQSPVTDQKIEERFRHNRGNLREMLFDLYDVHERAQTGKTGSSDSTSP